MGLTKPRAHQLQDIDYKQTARALTDTNITLSGGAPATVDGVSLSLHDRVLVTGQTDASENGIYYVTTVGAGSNGTWARSLDANETGELNGGTIIMVTEGTNHADTQWKLTTDDPITIGSTNLNFALNSSAAYGVIAVAGQSSIAANSVGDTLTVATGNNIVVTTNAGTETLTIAVSDTITATGNITGGNITTAGIGTFGTMTDGTVSFTSGNISGVDELRIDQSGTGLRMTNVGAFDNDGSDNFRIFSTNDLKIAANGENGTAITVDATNQDVTVTNDLRVDAGNLYIGGTAVTATATELNLLDGVTGLTLGTANEILIVGSDNTSIEGTDILTIDTASNYVGINQTSPEVTLHMTGEGAQTTQIRMEQYNDSADAPDVRTRRYRGTIASPAAVQSGDYLFRSNHEYYNGTSLLVGGAFAFDNTNNAARTQFSVAVDTDGTGADPQGTNGQFKIDGNDGGAITFNNAYKFPTTDGSADQVLATDGSGTLSFVDQSGGGGSGHTIQNAGSSLTARTNLNFDGTYLVATDDAGNDQTDVTIGSGVVTTTGTQTLTNKTLTSPNMTSPAIGGTTITATAAEINILDGVTATTTELNYVDGVTSNVQTQLDGKQASGSYLTGNQTITLSGDATGSGTTSIAVTVADDSHNHIISNVDGLQTALDAKLALAGGTMTGSLNIGSTIGTRANSLSIESPGSNSPWAAKSGTYATVASILPWSSCHNYIGTGVYYDDGAWVHASDNTTNSLFALHGAGANWYSSNNSTGSWNVASGVTLWNASGQWTGDINTTYDINTGVITGTATSARYADLAERYTTDADYEAGTVVVFGGEEEVTQSTQRLDRRVAGIVSTDPAYLMNSELENSVAVGLQGRVPCKVVGEIRKGDMMVTSSTPGHAEAWREESNPPMGGVIGKALENKTGAGADVIEVVVGRL